MLFFVRVFALFFCRFCVFFLSNFGRKKFCPAIFMSVAFFENSITGPIFVARFWTFFRTVLDARLRTFFHFFVAVFVLFLLPFWHSFWHRFGSKNEPNWGPKMVPKPYFPALWRISHRFFWGCLFTWKKKSRPAVHLAVPVARFFYPVIFWANRLGAGSERQRPTAGPANGWSTSLPAPLTRGLQHIWTIAVFVIIWGIWLGRAITFSGCRLAG